MASKKKRPARATSKKAKAKPTKAKTKQKAKAKAKPKAKAKAKAKAKSHEKPKAKAKAKAKVGKRSAKPTAARKRKPVAVAKPKAQRSSQGPIVLDEVIEEPILDASTILRVKDNVARAQRAGDEDELKQFADPSIVVEAQTRDPRRAEDDTDPSLDGLPDLFAAEARRQKQRLADGAADGAKAPNDRSLFGSLGSDASKESDDDDEADSD